MAPFCSESDFGFKLWGTHPSQNSKGYPQVLSIWPKKNPGTYNTIQYAVFQITLKGWVPTGSFQGVNRCGSPHTISSLPFILLGQVASFLRFLTRDPSFIWNTGIVQYGKVSFFKFQLSFIFRTPPPLSLGFSMPLANLP